ncbi:MAG: hypothetical protein ACI4QR_05615, partial [Eubacteriales bacterium]
DTVSVDMSEIVKEIVGETFDPESDRFYLLPASTYSGFNGTIWQTGSAKNDGSYAEGAIFEAGHKIKWNTSTSAFEGHFIDVPLYFRTDGGQDLNIALSESATSINPVNENGNDNDIEKAVRVAFLNKDCDKTSMGAGVDKPLVLASKNSTGLHDGEVIESVDAAGNISSAIPPKYLSFTDGKTEQLFTVNHEGVTQITVRIWVEGQDKSCIAKIGGQTFSVSLGFCVIEDNSSQS